MNIRVLTERENGGLGKAGRMHADVLGSFVTLSELGSSTYCHGSPTLAKQLATKDNNIAFWMCETNKLQKEYKQQADRFEQIWTASTYCQQILSNELNRDVKVVPHYTEQYSFKHNNEGLVILIAFDAASRIQRKNPVQAIQAVRNAFGRNAKILIKTRNLSDSLVSWLASECRDSPYEIVNKELSQGEMTELYQRARIYLSLHRAEGFGLHLLEAMAYGLIVVGTGFGGCMDFMREDNSFAVEYKLVDVNDDYFLGQWAEPDMDSAVSQLTNAAVASELVRVKAFSKALEYNKTQTIMHTWAALQTV